MGKEEIACNEQFQMIKFQDFSEFRAIADDKINFAEKINFVLGRTEKMVEKGKKCWLPAFYPLSTMFSRAILAQGS